ncbi:hypothetical protein [Streptomyces mirabilis]|uniref:hypothetical protein n=1 Tax=Streptomyces mirabilis TaxID=68239 RepID=UPI003F68A4C7
MIGLLSARAPRLDRALKKIARKGGVVVLLDGTLIRTRRRCPILVVNPNSLVMSRS